ncbi:hypothetical protein KUV86_15005 [Halomonas sp. DP8Y7-3]|uniref:hypothetical protein n=1 Tax=Halomonas sp. DP8Y7-3 TaxID=2859079 RepID=UPI001C948ECE|nr:hypothetical protein [Halomonas sp. DP8Y7-3]MBY5930417.1 hypothetical protein [Halomonas sp. DP8Y7-3]
MNDVKVTKDVDGVSDVKDVNEVSRENAVNDVDHLGQALPSSSAVAAPTAISERSVWRINFQPEASTAVDGYAVDSGKAFGEQAIEVGGVSHQYGWVSGASIADGVDNGTTPLSLVDVDASLLVDRSENFDGLDPRQASYAQMTRDDDGAVNAGWEIELAPGFYEVTLAVGDVSGRFDAFYQVNAEGASLIDGFVPARPGDFPLDANVTDDTDGFRTTLVTRVVEVNDGRLTLDALGADARNVKLQYVEIQSLPDPTPGDDRDAVDDYARFVGARAVAGVGSQAVEVALDRDDGGLPTGVDPASDIFVGVQVVEGRGGVLLESLADGSVRLFETVTGVEVNFDINTTGGFDSLTLSPVDPLKPYTSYTLVIDGFQDRGDNSDIDAPTRDFLKYTNTFVTGPVTERDADVDVAFEGTVELDGAADDAVAFTSLTLNGAGDTLYVVSMGGQIRRYGLDPEDGSLGPGEVLDLGWDPFAQPDSVTDNVRRAIIGVAEDPSDPQVLWVTDNYPVPLLGQVRRVPDFSGRLLKITLDEDGSFSGQVEVYLTGLPRSAADHVTNSIEFRKNPEFDPDSPDAGPEYLLYLTQGSNTGVGGVDSAWANRPERLLSATVLEIDPSRTPPEGGFDLTTEPLPEDQTRFRDDDNNLKDGPISMGDGRYLVFDERGVASVQDVDGNVLSTFYDPFAEDAVAKIFATGIRNAYDLVWHSDGRLYVPTNGGAAGGVVPDDPVTPGDESLISVGLQDDYLFTVDQGGYYGHGNPLRDEYILDGGNPTRFDDANEVSTYAPGTQPDPNYRVEDTYALGPNRSPNGATEFTSDIFGDALKGSLLFTEFSGGNDIRWIRLDDDGKVISDDVLRDSDGGVIRYNSPLDIIENPATGQLYLLTLNRRTGESQLVRLDPVLPEPPEPPEPPEQPVKLATIQAEDDTPNDGTSATLSMTGDVAIFQGIAEGTPGLRPGSYGNDGNLDDRDGVGGGYADFGVSAQDWITFGFTLAPEEAGYNVLRIRYANGGGKERPLEIFINGESHGLVSFPAAPSLPSLDERWNLWMTQDVQIDLPAGEVEVRLQSLGRAGPNIDQLEVWQGDVFGHTSYEAEEALLQGVAPTPDDSGRDASGEAYVALSDAQEQRITWAIRVEQDGHYELGFRYYLPADGEPRQLPFSLDGVELAPLQLAADSETADDWVYVNVEVFLEAGSHALALASAGESAVDVDLLWVPDLSREAIREAINHPADATDGMRIALDDGVSGLVSSPRSADAFFTVSESGLYRLDLTVGEPGDEIDVTLNGEPLPPALQADDGSGGVFWYVELEAGTEYRWHLISDDDSSSRVEAVEVAPVAVAEGADVSLVNAESQFFHDRLLFNYLDINDFAAPDRDFRETGLARITNEGSEPLQILNAMLDGPFRLADADALQGRVLAAGESIDITVMFDRDSYQAPERNDDDGRFFGRLTLLTNDADSPVTSLELAGFWQAQDEGGWEPTVDEIWSVAGLGNRIGGLPLAGGGGGPGSPLYDFGYYRPVTDEEVLSRYWTFADGVDSVRITQLASMQNPGGAALGVHAFQDTSQDLSLLPHGPDQNQSLLPRTFGRGEFPEVTLQRSDIPEDWTGDALFGFEIARLSSDPSLNPTGQGTPPANGPDLERGYFIRLFQALDEEGNDIPDTYLVIQDFNGGNFDYNDNMYVIEGIKPMYDGDGVVPTALMTGQRPEQQPDQQPAADVTMWSEEAPQPDVSPQQELRQRLLRQEPEQQQSEQQRQAPPPSDDIVEVQGLPDAGSDSW